ncbi:MAG TPA: nucleoside triphosphate pyrophosphohydrolase [Methylocella sp.]|nr:nucleoside triphosphate pyrophosphohydrolase [Methylocella sp.]
MQPSRDIRRLVEIIEALRHPETGCAWDRQQTFETIVPYTLEEAYEVADAAARGDMDSLRDELGDLLLQVVYHSRIAEELGYFDFGQVVETITQKMIRRHPHVFGERVRLSPGELESLWDAIKEKEKLGKSAMAGAAGGEHNGSNVTQASVLDGVPLALPALTRATKLQSRAASAGFDWDGAKQVIEKIREELAEIEAALAAGKPGAIEEEIGDLLFSTVNLARHAKASPEAAVRRANAKFERRFRFIENALARLGKTPREATLQEMEELWSIAKQAETGE